MTSEPELARSIFGVDAIDEFTVVVTDWIWDHCQHLADVEVRSCVTD